MRTFTVSDDLLHQLMPIEEYVTRTHEVPYCYQLSVGNRTLSVFGSAHSNVPEEAQFTLLEETVRRVEPEVVFVEGFGTHLTPANITALLRQVSRNEAIVRGGESFFALWLAHRTGADWQTIEPGDDELYAYLEALGFSRDHIFAWVVLRLLPQYIRRQESVSFAEYVAPFVAECMSATKWDDAQYAVDRAFTIAAEVLGSELSDSNFSLALRYTDPRAVATHDNDYTVFNTLSAVANELRDRTAVTKVLRSLAAAERVLMVVGAGHAVMQEPVYRACFARF